jgi:hypothetical protein
LVPSSLLLNAGNLTLSAPGGADVGPFQAAITVPSAFELTWTNQPSPPAILTINRSQGLTVNWSGAPAGQPVIIFGGGVDLPSNSSGVFACVAPAGSSSFTVPAIALGNIPATRRNLLQSKGVVYVGALPASNPTMFTASGLDVGAIVTGAFAGRTVVFQ